MKESTDTFVEGLTKGLRKFATNPRGEEALVECHNLAPGEQGLEEHEPLTSMDASGISWGGYGSKADPGTSKTVTIAIADYVDDSDIAGASVYIDDILAGTTDANGEIEITTTVGGHSIKVTKTGYVDSDADDLLNDYFVVT